MDQVAVCNSKRLDGKRQTADPSQTEYRGYILDKTVALEKKLVSCVTDIKFPMPKNTKSISMTCLLECMSTTDRRLSGFMIASQNNQISRLCSRTSVMLRIL